MRDPIDRRQAIDAVSELLKRVFPEHQQIAEKCLNALPSAQPEEAIPVAWLEEQARWFENMDNAFAKIEANNIRVTIKRWRGEKDERPDKQTGGD